jgi:hypothetical protein
MGEAATVGAPVDGDLPREKMQAQDWSGETGDAAQVAEQALSASSTIRLMVRAQRPHCALQPKQA